LAGIASNGHFVALSVHPASYPHTVCQVRVGLKKFTRRTADVLPLDLESLQMNDTTAQMELTFNQAANLARKTNRNARRQRSGAQWWFSQMRQIVQRALPGSSGPQPPAMQTYLEGGFIRSLGGGNSSQIS
jgi:hypothetical protein